MKIKIPDGFEIPPEIRPGETFTVVAEFKDNQDGTITLTAIDDAEVRDGDETEEVETAVEERVPMQKDAATRARESGYTLSSR